MRKSDISSLRENFPSTGQSGGPISRSEWQGMFRPEDENLIIAVLMGEARKHPIEGSIEEKLARVEGAMRHVGEVIHNRIALASSGRAAEVKYTSWGTTPHSVMTARAQFSCLNNSSKNNFYKNAQDVIAGKDPKKIFFGDDLESYPIAKKVAAALMRGDLSNEHGADHYFARRGAGNKLVKAKWTRQGNNILFSAEKHHFSKRIPGDIKNLQVYEDNDPRYKALFEQRLREAQAPALPDAFNLVASLMGKAGAPEVKATQTAQHQVQAGETLGDIVRERMGVPPSRALLREICELSGIRNPNRISVGQIITFPQSEQRGVDSVAEAVTEDRNPPLPVKKEDVAADSKGGGEIVIGVQGNLTKTVQKAASQFGIDMSIKEAYKTAVQYAENHGIDADHVQKGKQLAFERDDFTPS